MNPIELLISEASSRGLRIERLPINSKRHTFDRRLLLIEGRRCQVIPTKLGHPSEEYPDAQYLSLYLPRGEWPDYLIYVLSGSESAFWIVPRVEMSKDTGRTPESMESYREAWDLLRQGLDESPKQFEVLNWQLKAVKASAQEAGLQIELIPTKKHREGRRWPPVVKRRIIVAGKKCSIFSAARISQDREKPQYNYAVFRVSAEEWCDFYIYVVKGFDEGSDVFVVPRGHMTKSTSACLDHPELAKYKNAWALLTSTEEPPTESLPIRWREPATPEPPTRRSIVLQKALREAEAYGLFVESTEGPSRSYPGGQSFLHISGKRCQVMQATCRKGTNGFPYLCLNPATSQWAEFLVFYSVVADTPDVEKFYIFPRAALLRQTARSPESKWLKQYEGAWHLLG